jgi:hypothetical protein
MAGELKFTSVATAIVIEKVTNVKLEPESLLT